MITKNKQLKVGIVISFFNLALGNLIPFIYTPIMLRILGQAEYGLYGIASSVMGYVQLLNFGIGGAIVRYIAKYRAEGDKKQEEAVIGLFIKLYCCIAVLIMCAGFFASDNLEIFSRSMTENEILELRILVRFMTINMAIFLPFSVFSSITLAHEEYVFNKIMDIGCTVLTPLLNIIMLFQGKGAIGLVATTTIVQAFTYSIYCYYSLKRLKIHPRFNIRIPGLVKEIGMFSFFVFLGSIVDTLYWTTDKLIIGWALGTVATAVYNIGATFNGYVTSLSTAISGVLTPKVTIMSVEGANGETFTKLFIKIGRLQFILVSFIVSAFVAFGQQFIELWAGKNYIQAYYVALLVMIPVTIPLIQNTGINILYALNKHQFRSITYLVIAIINIVLTFWWVESYGIIGAAMATCVAYVVGNIFVMNWYYWKRIGIDIPLFWKNIVKMSPVMIIMLLVGKEIVQHWWKRTWGSFLLIAIGYTIVYFALAYVFMMNDYERNTFKSPLTKLISKLKRKQGEE